MINNILKKCLEELSKESPKLDYVRGMLETVIEMTEIPKDAYIKANGDGTIVLTMPQKELETARIMTNTNMATSDEGQLMDVQAKANLAKVKALAAKSVEMS